MGETIRHWRPRVLLALLGTWMSLSGCTAKSSSENPSPIGSPPPTGNKQEVVASVGGVSITREQLTDRLLEDHGAQTLRAMMLVEAVNKEADKLQVTVTDEEIAQEILTMRKATRTNGSFMTS